MKARVMALFAATIATTARAQEHAPAPTDAGLFPGGKSYAPHFVFGALLGSCTLHDADLGNTSVCGEVALGFDAPFRTTWKGQPRRTWHFGAEIGFGARGAMSSGDSLVGIAMATGGPFLSTRTWATYDFTRLFFLRAGPEALFAVQLDRVTPSVHGFIDVGSRAGSCVEIGIRGTLGADGITKTGDGDAILDWSFSWGSMIFARFYSP